MATRIPFQLDATLQGRKPASSFTSRQDGREVVVPEKLQFLTTAPDGSVQLVEVGGGTFDKMVPPVDHATFKLGDRFSISGAAVIQERGSEKDSFVAFDAVVPASAKSADLRAAS